MRVRIYCETCKKVVPLNSCQMVGGSQKEYTLFIKCDEHVGPRVITESRSSAVLYTLYLKALRREHAQAQISG